MATRKEIASTLQNFFMNYENTEILNTMTGETVTTKEVVDFLNKEITALSRKTVRKPKPADEMLSEQIHEILAEAENAMTATEIAKAILENTNQYFATAKIVATMKKMGNVETLADKKTHKYILIVEA